MVFPMKSTGRNPIISIFVNAFAFPLECLFVLLFVCLHIWWLLVCLCIFCVCVSHLSLRLCGCCVLFMIRLDGLCGSFVRLSSVQPVVL